MGADISSFFHASGISNVRISYTSRLFFFFFLSKRPSAAVESTKSLNPTDTGLKDAGGVHRYQANLIPIEKNWHKKPRARQTIAMNDAILDK